MDNATILTILERHPFLIGIVAGFLLFALFALLIRLVRRPPETFEAFSNEAGKVLISRQALQEQIQRCCEDLVDVGRARVKVLSKRELVSIHVRLKIKSNAKLVGISSYLQGQISSVLHKNLGVENVGPIDILVTGILPQSGKETTNITPEEKSAE